jgi:predicted phosphodiesterase
VKIAIASDLHLEFGDLEIANDDKADVLILSGDILVVKDIAQRDPYGVMGPEYRSNRYHDFMQRCSAQFPHVIYVMGNHEHYNGDFAKTETHLKDVLGYLKNVYVLEKEIKVIDDVTFIGGTLWTDMNNGDSLTLYHMKAMMNDFRCVENSNRVVNYKAYEQINGVDNRDKPIFKTRTAKFQPEDAFEEHAKFKGYIQQIIQGKFDQKFVVCGHHSPSKQSTHPMYADDTVMNGGYSSDMDEFIADHPQIKLWTHGHTHHPFDYVVGETRIVCNPRGYINYEPQASEFKLLTVEV